AELRRHAAQRTKSHPRHLRLRRCAVSEAVADAANGDDQPRLVRIALELLAQVPDVHVDRAGLAVGGVAPELLEQHLTAEHAARSLGDRPQDLELALGP